MFHFYLESAGVARGILKYVKHSAENLWRRSGQSAHEGYAKFTRVAYLGEGGWNILIF